jgi:hypothetical protein
MVGQNRPFRSRKPHGQTEIVAQNIQKYVSQVAELALRLPNAQHGMNEWTRHPMAKATPHSRTHEVQKKAVGFSSNINFKYSTLFGVYCIFCWRSGASEMRPTLRHAGPDSGDG